MLDLKRAIERVPLSQKDNLLCKKSERETLQKGGVPSSVQKRIENEKKPSVVTNASITMPLLTDIIWSQLMKMPNNFHAIGGVRRGKLINNREFDE